MANVSFHVGTLNPGTSGLTAGGIYVNSSAGRIFYASSATSKVELGKSYSHLYTSSVSSLDSNDVGTNPYLYLIVFVYGNYATNRSASSTSVVYPYGSLAGQTNSVNSYYGSATMICNTSSKWVLGIPCLQVHKNSSLTSTVTWYDATQTSISVNTNTTTKIFEVIPYQT